jgi:hypothetical protein
MLYMRYLGAQFRVAMPLRAPHIQRARTSCTRLAIALSNWTLYCISTTAEV